MRSASALCSLGLVLLLPLTASVSAQDGESSWSDAPAPASAEPAPGDAPEAPGPDETPAEQQAEPAKQAAPSEPPSWWFGAYVQGAFVPSFMLHLFLSDAPTVANAGFGVVATHRDKNGFSVVLGLGYQSYSFHGPFRIKGDPEDDTEWVDSDLGLLHLRGELTWSLDIVPNTLSFEYGVGLDFGVVLGQMVRSEAYRNPLSGGAWSRCAGPLAPPVISLSGRYYCEQPQHYPTDAYNQHGAQYNVVEKRVPPVALIPMLPVLALRYTPVRQVAVRLDAAFGLMQFEIGLSAAYGVDL